MSQGFLELGLSAETVTAIEALGYERPTPIQAQAIPILKTGADLVAQAQTGTGKTAAFGLPLVERVDPMKPTPQALVLCPTRELATQVAEAISHIGRSRQLRTTCVYGGQPIYRQIRALQAGAHVVVATPGRLLDHLRRGTLDPALVSMVVLDEADEMLAMGFLEDVETILSQIPAERQIALFSATMPPQIRRLAQRHLKDPKTVAIDGGRQQVALIRQTYYEVLPHQKIEALMRIFDLETPGPTIVFCRTRKGCDDVGERLAAQGFLADRLHGDLEQPERDRVMKRFKDGIVDILVATDVAARGLDIETVTHVINFDVPWDPESYTHRIGRTGRAGREGDAVLFIEPKERRHLHMIERATGNRLKPARIPTLADIKVRRSERLKEQLANLIVKGGLESERALAEGLELDPLDVAAAALRLLAEAKPSREERIAEEDLNRTQPHAPAEAGMVRLVLSLGRKDQIRPADIVGAISNEAGIPGRRIGAIDINDTSTFVEVPHDHAERIIEALSRTRIRSRRFRVERQRDGHRPRLGAVPGRFSDRMDTRPVIRPPVARPEAPKPEAPKPEAPVAQEQKPAPTPKAPVAQEQKPAPTPEAPKPPAKQEPVERPGDRIAANHGNGARLPRPEKAPRRPDGWKPQGGPPRKEKHKHQAHTPASPKPPAPAHKPHRPEQPGDKPQAPRHQRRREKREQMRRDKRG